MHKGFIFLILALSVVLSACKKEVFTLNEEVSIGFKTTIIVETTDNGQLDIRYTELVSESRCPPDVTCVWAGYVKIKLKLDGEQFVELGLGETTVDSVEYKNHMIKLLAVEYDTDNNFGMEKKSSVVIRVD